MEIELDESSIYFFYSVIQTTTDNIRTLTYTIAASHLVGDILNREMIQTSTESFQNSPSPVTTQLSEISRISAFGERQRAMGELSKIMSAGRER